MSRKIIAYENYYKDFFDTLDKGTQEKVLYGLLLLKTQDRLPAKYVKFLKEGLYELRIEWQGNIYRIFFCYDEGHIVILFNGFQKKTQKTPDREIDKALKQVKKYKYNFYQKVSILTMIICFFMGIILGNIFPSCVSSGLYSATCTTTEYNISLTIFFWFASFLLCMFIYAIGHIINILETINKNISNSK